MYWCSPEYWCNPISCTNYPLFMVWMDAKFKLVPIHVHGLGTLLDCVQYHLCVQLNGML